jgi:hypothetical protein
LPVAVERHAELAQPVDRRGRALDHELDRLAPVEPGAGDHGVADVLLERVAGIEHRAIPPCAHGGRAAGQRALGEHQHLARSRQRQRAVSPAAPEPTMTTSYSCCTVAMGLLAHP